MRDLHELPKFADGTSYLYVEHCKVEQDKLSVSLFDKEGQVQVPCAGLAVLMLGPGTSITHAAVRVLAENGVFIVWVGEEGIRLYAQGLGKTRSAHNIMKQARLSSYPETRLRVVERMYRMRFADAKTDGLSIQQLRGMEGARVRAAYARASQETGIPWRGRRYKPGACTITDPVNRALTVANSCLYGICHAAIVVAGYSPALGFIHVGHQMSFTFDIADLYKAELIIPLAFNLVKASDQDIERRARMACRDAFKSQRLLARIIPDIERLMDLSTLGIAGTDLPSDVSPDDMDSDKAIPNRLWDPEVGSVEGGTNFDAADLVASGAGEDDEKGMHDVGDRVDQEQREKRVDAGDAKQADRSDRMDRSDRGDGGVSNLDESSEEHHQS